MRIHLEDKAQDAGTLCGSHLRMETIRDIATGWPDRDACLKKTEPEAKPAWLA